MVEKSHANQRKYRGPQVLKDIPLRNWYRSELEHQLNTMDIVFMNRDKVTSLIRKLEKANFALSSLGDDRGKNRDRRRPRPSLRPRVQEPSSTHRQSAHEPVTGQGSGTNLDDPEDLLQPFASSSSTTDTRARSRPREMTRRKHVRLASRGNPEKCSRTVQVIPRAATKKRMRIFLVGLDLPQEKDRTWTSSKKLPRQFAIAFRK